MNEVNKKFQSPCGEEVMQPRSKAREGNVAKKFQSPCGEEVMQLKKVKESAFKRLERFSPLAGKR